jgi:hypothetical protein
MATPHLRRTFAYPTESDSDDPPDLDEEHQEALLTDLQTQDEATSLLYKHIFLALPVLTSLAYIPTLFAASTATQKFIALLTIIVPAQAAWVLYFYPVGISWHGGLSLRALGVGYGRGEDPKPREWYLILLGAILAGMLVLRSLGTWWGGRGGEEGWGELVPAGEFASIFACC